MPDTGSANCGRIGLQAFLRRKQQGVNPIMNNEISENMMLFRRNIENIKEYLNESILLSGFVENFRDSKSMAFIVLKDITGKVQITINKDEHPELLEELAKVTLDSVITVEGVAVKNEYVKLNGIEFLPTALKVDSVAEPLPIVREAIPATKKKPALERSDIDVRLD